MIRDESFICWICTTLRRLCRLSRTYLLTNNIRRFLTVSQRYSTQTSRDARKQGNIALPYLVYVLISPSKLYIFLTESHAARKRALETIIQTDTPKMVYTTQYDHPSTNWNKVLPASKRCFVHRIFDMASTLLVLADEPARNEAIAMVCLNQDPFEFDTKRACNILKRLNAVSGRVARGRGCFVVAPKSSYPSSPPEFFSTDERREERHCVAFFGGARHFAKTHLSHSI